MGRSNVLADENYNPFIFSMIIFGVIFISWGALNKVEAGTLYVTLFLVTIGIISLVKSNIKEDKATLKKLYKSPFLSSTKVAIAMYLLGYVVIFGINFFGKFIKNSFSTLQFFSPLYFSGSGGGGSGISSTYLASVIENTAGFKLAYSVFVAGTIEEFVFGFALFLGGWIISFFILEFLFDNKAPFGLSNKTFSKLFSYAFVIVTFTGIHVLNASYEGVMFVWAGLFRLLMTIALYELGLGLSFTMGMHHANNFFAFLFFEGVAGLNSTTGILYIIFMLGLLSFTIKNIFTKKFRKDFKKDIKDYRL